MAAEGNSVPFLTPEPEHTLSARTWAIAALVILVLLAVAAIVTVRRNPANTGVAAAPDAYASNLHVSNVSLSEATNGAGGKSTYVDGTVRNTGTRTVTAALVQVTFATASGPHRETLPLALVRTRVPYVDLQPVSADPIAPGAQREFRLIFEAVPADWDVQAPAMTVVHTELK